MVSFEYVIYFIQFFFYMDRSLSLNNSKSKEKEDSNIKAQKNSKGLQLQKNLDETVFILFSINL